MAFFQFKKQSDASANVSARLVVKFTEKGIAEIVDGRTVVFIPREKIQRVELMYGSQAERPLLQLLLGALLVSVGVAGFLMAEHGAAYRGFGLLAFGLIGCYCLYEALRRGHYLGVTCVSDKRKIHLGGVISDQRFRQLKYQAAESGYDLLDGPVEKKSALVASS